MNFWVEFIAECGKHFAKHYIEKEEKEKEKALEEQWNLRVEAYNKVKTRVLFYLKNDYPIPMEFKLSHPIVVVDTCKEQGKANLVKDVIPEYKDAKKNLKKDPLYRYQLRKSTYQLIEIVLIAGLIITIAIGLFRDS